MPGPPYPLRVRAWIAQQICRRLPPFLAYRLHRLLFEDLIGSGVPFRARALFGPRTISGVLNDYEDVYFALHGTKNFKGMAIAASILSPGDVVFEIGANLGTETLALANLVAPSGRVIAVEADPDLAAVLSTRVHEAGAANIDVVNKAASASPDPLYVHRGRAFYSGQTFVSDQPTEDGTRIECITGDQLVEEYGAPAFVFMDIEGSEAAFLQGSGSLLRESRPIIFTEVVAALLRRNGASISRFATLVIDAGYVAFDTDTRTLSQVDLQNASEDVSNDWLLVPRERLEVIGTLRTEVFRARVMPRVFGLNPLDRRYFHHG